MRHHYTVYDIYYQYEAGGNIYTNMIYGSNSGKNYGETFEVKYNPLAPRNSTCDLQPSFGVVISGAVGFVIFGAIGLRMLQCVIPRQRKRSATKRKKSSEQE